MWDPHRPFFLSLTPLRRGSSQVVFPLPSSWRLGFPYFSYCATPRLLFSRYVSPSAYSYVSRTVCALFGALMAPLSCSLPGECSFFFTVRLYLPQIWAFNAVIKQPVPRKLIRFVPYAHIYLRSGHLMFAAGPSLPGDR